MSKQEPSVKELTDLREQAISEARRDGIFAGLTSGLTGALVGSNLMRFNRNKSIFCGVLTGLLSGYFFMQAFEASNLSRANSTLLEWSMLGKHVTDAYHCQLVGRTPVGTVNWKRMKLSGERSGPEYEIGPAAREVLQEATELTLMDRCGQIRVLW